MAQQVDSQQEVKQLQQKLFQIYQEIQKICIRHQLKFFAAGGTCLGAIRHQGFIPWDDDMDIVMPRKDYELFKKYAAKELPDNLEIIDQNHSLYTTELYIKIHDKQTTCVPNALIGLNACYYGIFIDVFPLDGTPDSKLKRWLYLKFLKFLVIGNRSIRLPHKYLSKKNKLFLWFFIPFKWFCSPYYFANLHAKYSRKYDFETSEYWAATYFSCVERLVFKTQWFRESVEKPFESGTIPCTIDYDKYLRAEYGDYLQLPPEEKRVYVHSDGILDFEKSYREYQKEDL